MLEIITQEELREKGWKEVGMADLKNYIIYKKGDERLLYFSPKEQIMARHEVNQKPTIFDSIKKYFTKLKPIKNA